MGNTEKVDKKACAPERFPQLSAFFRHPFFNSFLTLLIIVTGGVGAIYSDEIRKSFPFYWGQGPWSFKAMLFWALTFLASSLFFFREQAVTRAQERAQGLLERLIRTLPPENFLAVFSRLFGAAYKLVEAADMASKEPDNEKANIERSVRQILQMIATLAQKFDGDDPNCCYGANVMFFIPAVNILPSEEVQFRKELLFCDPSVGLKHLHGILRLHTELSAITSDEEVKSDPTLTVFGLPIPISPKNDNGYTVLPGAPLAFVTKQPDVYTDSRTLGKWCEEYGDFTREVTQSVEDFFQKSAVRSFISIPLFPLKDDGGDDDSKEPFAILNVHSEEENLLTERGEPLMHYVAVLRPFQIFLVRLLFRLNPPKSGVAS